MSDQSPRNAFNEVRAILGKLDRSIDEARSKRLEPDRPAHREPGAGSSGLGREPSSELDREIGGSASGDSKTELQRKGASFGRAKPLNRGGEVGANRDWKTPGEDDLIG